MNLQAFAAGVEGVAGRGALLVHVATLSSHYRPSFKVGFRFKKTEDSRHLDF